MEYPLQVDGFEGRRLAIVPAGMLSGTKLVIDGQPAPRGNKKHHYVLRRNNGMEVAAELKIPAFDPIPHLVIDNQIYRAVEPLKWYEWIITGLPLALIFVGGALGAVCGSIGFIINTRILRSESSVVRRYTLTAVVTVLTGAVYGMLVTFVRGLLQNI